MSAPLITPNTCSTCSNKVWITGKGGVQFIECHANPPVAQAHLVGANGNHEAQFITTTSWPQPKPELWCGQYRNRVLN